MEKEMKTKKIKMIFIILFILKKIFIDFIKKNKKII